MSHRFAALLVATAAVAALAGPAAGPAHAAKRLPDLATGTSDPSGAVGGARSRWRLAGRQLTITLPGAPVAGGRDTVTVTARCGEITSIPGRSEDVFPWATVTRGNARVRASTRTVRVVLTRDLAARANFCTLTLDGVTGLRAAMDVRRGARRGCRPGPRERVVHERDTIRVTAAHAEDASGSTVDGYRACRLPRGNLRRIERAGDSGGAGGSGTTATRFASSWVWLTWVSTYTPHFGLGGVQTATVRRLGLPGGVTLDVDKAPGTVSELAVDASGVTAWVRQPPAPGPATLQANAPGGTVVVLDRVEPIVCIQAPCPGAGPITEVRIRNRTVNWRNAGYIRYAALP